MPVELIPGAEPDPQYLLEVLEAFAECVRVANHQTARRGALMDTSEAAEAIRRITEAAQRLPQLLGQIAGWLAAEHEFGRIRVPEGLHAGRPGEAVAAAGSALDDAAAIARSLEGRLRAAAKETWRMRTVGNAG
jgi:hypothetical protein